MATPASGWWEPGSWMLGKEGTLWVGEFVSALLRSGLSLCLLLSFWGFLPLALRVLYSLWFYSARSGSLLSPKSNQDEVELFQE